MEKISLFPTYDSGTYGSVLKEASYHFSFERKNYVQPSPLEVTERGVIKDSNFETGHGGEWDPDSYPLCVEGRFILNNGKTLYGPEGVACTSAEIGLCVIWKSKSSFQRGVFSVGRIENSDNEQILTFSHKFPKGLLRGWIIFTAALYIMKQDSSPDESEKFLANETGYMLGELDTRTIVIDEESRLMPISIVEGGKGEPLWRLLFTWDDITDSFVDNVNLILNTQNVFFKYINKESKEFNVHFMREILASAFVQIMEKYKEADPDFSQLESAANDSPESIAAVVQYYKNVLEVDMTSVMSESEGIRKYFEKQIRE